MAFNIQHHIKRQATMTKEQFMEDFKENPTVEDWRWTRGKYNTTVYTTKTNTTYRKVRNILTKELDMSVPVDKQVRQRPGVVMITQGEQVWVVSYAKCDLRTVITNSVARLEEYNLTFKMFFEHITDSAMVYDKLMCDGVMGIKVPTPKKAAVKLAQI